MKTALKKSFVLIGIALFFVLMAWAEQKIWAWDKNVLEEEYCISGYFEKNGENATTVYWLLRLFPRFLGASVSIHSRIILCCIVFRLFFL